MYALYLAYYEATRCNYDLFRSNAIVSITQYKSS
jgi:hypothetical protein